MDTKQIGIIDCLKTLREVVNESADFYANGCNLCGLKKIGILPGNGTYWIRMLPGSNMIELMYACPELVLRDPGDVISCYSMKFFNIKEIAKMMFNDINRLERRR